MDSRWRSRLCGSAVSRSGGDTGGMMHQVSKPMLNETSKQLRITRLSKSLAAVSSKAQQRYGCSGGPRTYRCVSHAWCRLQQRPRHPLATKGHTKITCSTKLQRRACSTVTFMVIQRTSHANAMPDEAPCGLASKGTIFSSRAKSNSDCRVPNSCPILRATAVTHGYPGSVFSIACKEIA